MCVKWSIRGSKDYELIPSSGCFATSIKTLCFHSFSIKGDQDVDEDEDHVRLTCSDEALLVLVINTESLLQLLLERLVILLHQELGGKLTKLTKLEQTRP